MKRSPPFKLVLAACALSVATAASAAPVCTTQPKAKLIGAIGESVRHHENLPLAIISGYKRAGSYSGQVPVSHVVEMKYWQRAVPNMAPGGTNCCDRELANVTRLHLHPERHLVSRIGWLRAAVLGANDGIVSTASLIIGVAAAAAKPADILIAGAAGLVAGAMSMAAGEYVSVSSQADTEMADLARERAELAGDVDAEIAELAGIYTQRGVDAATAETVARQLMAKDALAAHAHDELGISNMTTARPVQAALTSAATFTAGAALPLAIVILAPASLLVLIEAAGSLLFLALLGAIGARAGGAPVWTATLRVTFWGALAMALTAGIGNLVGTAV